jgi:hypothetical protein
MYKLINKARQIIPVLIVKDGKTEYSHLTVDYQNNFPVYTEDLTEQVQNLVRKGLVLYKEVE